MKKLAAISVVCLFMSALGVSGDVVAKTVSPLTGQIDESTQTAASGASLGKPSPLALSVTALVPGGLYGTDGQNLYLIDKATGSASLIGSHGAVEFAIGALAFDSNGVLYGISLGNTARLYTIDPTTGAATAVGPLGIGFIFEGGLDFDASGRLFGVDQGDATNAKTFTIDPATGAATIIGPTPGDVRDINGLAFDGQAFFAIDRVSNSLGTLNTVTGAYTQIGNVGDTIGDTGGLAIDPADGTLYATFEDTGGFYTLNKTTGAATLIAVNNVDYGLAFAPREEECKPAPLTQGYWHRQCLGAGLITPGRNGRGKGPKRTTEPNFLDTLVPAVNTRLEQTVSISLACEEGMVANPPKSPCERALKQYTALLFNIESGRLQDSCEIDVPIAGCTSTTIGDLVNELAALINSGKTADCRMAAACAATVNEW